MASPFFFFQRKDLPEKDPPLKAPKKEGQVKPVPRPLKEVDPPIAFSFGGAGTKAVFNSGVVYYLLRSVPFDRERAQIYVISGGSLGVSLLVHSSPEEVMERTLGAIRIMNQLSFYKFPFAHIYKHCVMALDYFLPDDAHIKVGDRLHIGLTALPHFRPFRYSTRYNSKKELIHALIASCYIPGFFFNLPHPKHRFYLDGGFSHNFVPDLTSTVAISVNHLPESDVWLDEKLSYNLTLLPEQDYIKVFEEGIESGRKHHDKIVAKLRKAGLYLGDRLCSRL